MKHPSMLIDGVVTRFTKQCDVNHESIYQLGGVWLWNQNGIFLRPWGFHGSANGGVCSCFNYEGKGCEEILWGKKSTTPFKSGMFARCSFVWMKMCWTTHWSFRFWSSLVGKGNK